MIDFETVFYLPLLVLYAVVAMAAHSRKKIPLSRHLLYLALYVYVIWILSLTLFPIMIEHFVGREDLPNNYLPFKSILRQLKYEPFSQIVRQLGGNIAVFTPLGALLLLLRGRHLRLTQVLATGFMFSLSIEVTQFFIARVLGMGLRVFDVDDIILNVLGTVLGFIVAKYAFRLRKSDISKETERERNGQR